MIPLSQLTALFERIRATNDWPIDGPMLWGFFFRDHQSDRLKSLVPVLEREGYQVVELSLGQFNDDDAPYTILHVAKVEVLTPQTLYERNEQFFALAEQFELDGFDGMDVGPAPKASMPTTS